jgi:peptidoglycan/xylan/chitin deacetylase (PgdA/CDA1 family)
VGAGSRDRQIPSSLKGACWSLLPAAVRSALRGTGLHKAARLLCKGPVVLFYHGVVEHKDQPLMQYLHMPLGRFEREAAYLAREWEVISLDYLAQGLLEGKGLHRRQVVLTFDDGFRNNATLAAPVLEALNLPYAIFISTRMVEEGLRAPSYYMRAILFLSGLKKIKVPTLGVELSLEGDAAVENARQTLRKAMERLPQDKVRGIIQDLIDALPAERWTEIDKSLPSEAMMTWDEVEELGQGKQATIAAHCHDHAILHAAQSAEEVDYQLGESKNRIQARLGSCRYFAYPRGIASGVSPLALQKVEEHGFQLSFTTLAGEVHQVPSPHLLPRFSSPDLNSPGLESLSYLLSSRFRLQEEYLAQCQRILEARP